jgi:dihydroorotate dehydrogenase electron transfer subunit
MESVNKAVLTKAVVRGNAEIVPEHFEMTLEMRDAFRRPEAGQFVMIRIADGDVFLPRPFSVCGWEDAVSQRLKILYRVVGKGTARLSRLEPGRSVDVTGPFGRGFSVPDRGGDVVLLGGGIGMAPLLSLLDRCRETGAARSGRLVVYAGARTAAVLIGIARAGECGALVRISTDDGSEGFHGPVTERFAQERGEWDEKKASLYACGPRPMLRRLQDLLKGSPMPCEASLEERMACGLGACLGCAVAVRDDAGNRFFRRVCKEGPVFPLQDILWE